VITLRGNNEIGEQSAFSIKVEDIFTSVLKIFIDTRHIIAPLTGQINRCPKKISYGQLNIVIDELKFDAESVNLLN
jgi:hypothetical protein